MSCCEFYFTPLFYCHIRCIYNLATMESVKREDAPCVHFVLSRMYFSITQRNKFVLSWIDKGKVWALPAYCVLAPTNTMSWGEVWEERENQWASMCSVVSGVMSVNNNITYWLIPSTISHPERVCPTGVVCVVVWCGTTKLKCRIGVDEMTWRRLYTLNSSSSL